MFIVTEYAALKRRISNFYVRISQVIILEQNVPVMNKSQAEKKVSRFTQYSELTLMTLSCFRILQKRRQLIISLIHNLCQDFLKQ